MLDFLHKIGVTNTWLEINRGLNRKSLWSIAQGNDLRNAHEFYFHTLLQLLNDKMEETVKKYDVVMQESIKNIMFSVMKQEFGIINKFCCIK